MKTSSWLVVCGVVLYSTLLMKASTAGETPVPGGRGRAVAASVAGACDGEPCDAVARGFHAFFDRQLNGLAANGRACADCHMPTDNFQLSPASAEARFQFLQWRRRWNPDADDPLFRPIDADDFRINGDLATDFSNLRQNGLIRIAFPLPANVRLVDPLTNEVSAETEVDVWRSVPTVNDVALTGPDPASCGRAVRTSTAATSWTRGSARSRSRRLRPSPVTRRSRPRRRSGAR